MDIEPDLGRLLAAYRQQYPEQWSHLLGTLTWSLPRKPTQVDLEVYLWGSFLGSLHLEVPDALARACGLPERRKAALWKRLKRVEHAHRKRRRRHARGRTHRPVGSE